jgi:hypothetical protein
MAKCYCCYQGFSKQYTSRVDKKQHLKTVIETLIRINCSASEHQNMIISGLAQNLPFSYFSLPISMRYLRYNLAYNYL